MHAAPRATPSDAPPIPLAVPELAGNEARYLAECVESGFVSSVGPFVERFESMLTSTTRALHAAAVSSGSSALLLAMRAVGVKRDDLVAMPAFSFIATANAAHAAGATPWFFDIGDDGLTIDPDQLADELDKHTVPDDEGRPLHRTLGRRVSAIVPVHASGATPDLASLRAIAEAHNLPIVSDAAAAVGTRHHAGPITRSAHLACYSFNGNKTVTCGGGGAITGDDAGLLARIRHLSTQARVGEGYDHDEAGFNHRMTNLQAAVGCAQLERIVELLATKRAIRDRYEDAFADLDGVSVFPPRADGDGCWLSGVITERAPALLEALRSEGIGARSFWKPLHLQLPYVGAPRADLSRSEALWPTIVTLPCSTGLAPGEQRRVIEAVRSALG